MKLKGETGYEPLTSKEQSSNSLITATNERAQLFLGPDHLLIVLSQSYDETYHRIAYRDIQALLIRKTDRGLILGLLSTAIILILFVIAFTIGNLYGWVIFGAMILTLMIYVIRLTFAGPSCICYVRTAVQVRELPGIHRRNHARSALHRLAAKVREAQNEMEVPDPEDKPPMAG